MNLRSLFNAFGRKEFRKSTYIPSSTLGIGRAEVLAPVGVQFLPQSAISRPTVGKIEREKTSPSRNDFGVSTVIE